MRIGIDYTSAVHQGGGIGRLTRNVVRALAELDRENEYVLLVQGREIRHPPPTSHPRNVASGIANDNFGEVRTWLGERWWSRIWHRLHLPIVVEWIIGQIDLFHSPDFVLPPTLHRTHTIVTVHDLSFLRMPHCFPPPLLDYLTACVPRAVHRADHVLADSQSTRHDVIALLDVPEERVSVLYAGVEPRFRPIGERDELERVRRKYNLPPRFVLSVGTVQPRKNYGRLIAAFARLPDTGLSLVIAGGRGWMYEEVEEAARAMGNRVKLIGFVDDADLPALYTLAEVFALPSLYEGFGLPPLEAMACGTPVIVGDNSSLPEVVGEAGLRVEATDVESIATAIERLLGDHSLRQQCRERGLARARQFTWERAARELLATYRRVGER